MFDINHLEIMEKFYISTDLPIMAMYYDGTIIGSYGYSNDFQILFENNKIDEKIINLLKENKESKWISLPVFKSTFFSGCYINPNNSFSGFYILGPHSCMKNNPMGIPHKPKCIIGNLIPLLYSFDESRHSKSLTNASYSYHVKKALDYINSRYREDISLGQVANYLNINKSYLCSIFKKETGMTFTQKLNEVRIEKSKSLLKDCNSSLLDIALQVGFNNQNYFNIMFKKITNMTPMQYRDKNCRI